MGAAVPEAVPAPWVCPLGLSWGWAGEGGCLEAFAVLDSKPGKDSGDVLGQSLARSQCGDVLGQSLARSQGRDVLGQSLARSQGGDILGQSLAGSQRREVLGQSLARSQRKLWNCSIFFPYTSASPPRALASG